MKKQSRQNISILLQAKLTAQAIRWVASASPKTLPANLILMVARGLVPATILYLIKSLIDSLTLSVSTQQPSPGRQTILLIICLTGCLMFDTFLKALSEFFGMVQSRQVAADIQDKIHERSLMLDMSYYDTVDAHHSLFRAQQEGPYRPEPLVKNLLGLGQQAISLLGILAILFSTHPFFPILLILSAFPVLLVKIYHSGVLFEWRKARTKDERRAHYYNRLITGKPAAHELRLFQLGPEIKSRFKSLQEQIRKASIALKKRDIFWQTGAQSISIIVVVLGLYWMARGTTKGEHTLGVFVMAFQGLHKGQALLVQLAQTLGNVYENNLFLSHLLAFLHQTPVQKRPGKSIPQRPHGPGKIAIQNLYFRYPESERNIISNLSLTIEAGEHVALVGLNGAGKSTLLKLLCGLYPPSSGKISIDGTDLGQISPDEWRSRITALFQDFMQYHASLDDNIWFGDSKTSFNISRAELAMQNAGVPERLLSPAARKILLGKWLDTGETLSHGEWQRIALARAFYRKSQYVFLDEPAHAQDAESERQLFRTLKKLLKGKTALWISHRLSTAQLAHRIIVLHNGKIAESGGHQILLEKNGLYARWYAIQTGSRHASSHVTS